MKIEGGAAKRRSSVVPSNRLMIVVAGVVLPAATIGGLMTSAAPICLGLIAALGVAALIDAFAGAHRVEGIEIAAPGSIRLTKNVAANIPLAIRNGSGVSLSFRLALLLPAAIESENATEQTRAAPGASQFEWPCIGRARGDHAVESVHVETPSPMRLWLARAARPLACTVRVYPNLRDRATAALFLKTAAPGMRMRRQVGKGREFDNLRHYLAGDSFEDIHWKATARRGFPIVKLFRVEHAQEVYAVIDSSRLSAREGILENYVDAALHLALVAERQGDRFGLITFSDRTHRFVRAAGGLGHFRLCREAIYNLAAERVTPDFRDVFTTLQLNLRRRSLIFFFTSLDDALLAESFQREVTLPARRHLILVNITQTAAMKPLFTGEPPVDLDAAYQGLAGQMLWNRMRMLQMALGNHGVKLALVDPDRIKQDVTAEYLEVKRRQTL